MKTAENIRHTLYGPGEDVNDEIDQENDISKGERRRLDDTENNSGENDDKSLTNASMDNADEDGEPLNEKGFGDNYSGGDLDVPGYNDGYDEDQPDEYDDDDLLNEDDDNEEDEDE